MSQQIKTEIVISASKEKVWTILTAFEDYPKWNPFIISIEGELSVGSRLENTMMNDGKKFVFKPVVLSVVPNRSFEWLGSLFVKGIFDGHHYFEIVAINSSQVKLIHGENFNGILSSFILKRIGEQTKKNFILMNQAIKKLAEVN